MKLNFDKSDWTPVKFGDVTSEPKESVKDARNIFCRAGTIDAGNLPADRLEGIVAQPFQPYNFSDPVHPVILSPKDAA